MRWQQWHSCWLLHEPEDVGRQRAVAEALRDGLDDTERPGVAAALREQLVLAE